MIIRPLHLHCCIVFMVSTIYYVNASLPIFIPSQSMVLAPTNESMRACVYWISFPFWAFPNFVLQMIEVINGVKNHVRTFMLVSEWANGLIFMSLPKTGDWIAEALANERLKWNRRLISTVGRNVAPPMPLSFRRRHPLPVARHSWSLYAMCATQTNESEWKWWPFKIGWPLIEISTNEIEMADSLNFYGRIEISFPVSVYHLLLSATQIVPHPIDSIRLYTERTQRAIKAPSRTSQADCSDQSCVVKWALGSVARDSTFDFLVP